MYIFNSKNTVGGNYNVSFDVKDTNKALELLKDCLSRRTITPCEEELFLLHEGFDLDCLKAKLSPHKETSLRFIRGDPKRLQIYYYSFGKQIPKRSKICNIPIGKECLISSSVIECYMAPNIAFILRYLEPSVREVFLNSLTPEEIQYILELMKFDFEENLSGLFGSPYEIEKEKNRIFSFENTKLDDYKTVEKWMYFKEIFGCTTLSFDQYGGQGNYEEEGKDNSKIMELLQLKPKEYIKRPK